jgi:hypothetical protein
MESCQILIFLCLSVGLLNTLDLSSAQRVGSNNNNNNGGTSGPSRKPFNGENTGNVGERLILTPFLNNGSAREARELSKVKSLASTESYSGFLIVNSTFNSNLFFWFFPAQVRTD